MDLSAKALDVRRLTKSHPSFRRAVELGHDADELLQEVWLGLLVRQQGKSAFDPQRGSFSKWVYQVVRSVVSHVLERTHNRGKHEQVGRRDEIDGDVDAGAWAASHVEQDVGDTERARILGLLGPDEHSEVARFLVMGHTVDQARRRFGLSYHREIDRIAGRVRRMLTESIGVHGGERDKA